MERCQETKCKLFRSYFCFSVFFSQFCQHFFLPEVCVSLHLWSTFPSFIFRSVSVELKNWVIAMLPANYECLQQGN